MCTCMCIIINLRSFTVISLRECSYKSLINIKKEYPFQQEQEMKTKQNQKK